ncbi:MAG: hypothetical protein COC19_03405 [SAR86 cluster bacterium]|uniref:Porin n=1 Tax=SAR86 cluster bacterium TaxID=2030880 RepID=A0A2A4MP86_9GAMM|nr:MAG: hypothetical protein COC19_03405 [SAR86 cluster bacterium]
MKYIRYALMTAFIFLHSSNIAAQDSEPFLTFTGFVESRLGFRLQDDPHEKDMSIGEIRLQLETEKYFDNFTFNLAFDLVADTVLNRYQVDLSTGEGAVDLRQMNVEFSPLDFMDVKVGRQILTWGTGDLLFINDLFAKDWNSFLIGRDVEYLKAPSDAIKTSMFFDSINIDLVYVPKFSADRYIDGRPISYFDPVSGSLTGSENPLSVDKPQEWFEDDELAIRLYRSFGVFEAAAYYYSGFWKSPAGFDMTSTKALFPELDVIGASLRGPIAGGIANVELGYYDSEAGAATNALINNDEFRLLIGFEREIATELTLSLQYNLERKLDYADYKISLPQASIRDDENRHQVSIRLTKMLMQQNLQLSLFNFYSTNEKDGFLRLNASYKVSDSVKIEAGANILYGKDRQSFYGQLENNSNAFAALRFEF